MDSEEGSVSGVRSGTQATEHGGVPTEAAEASPGSGESSVGGRGSKRRVKISAAMASSVAQTGGSARVLRTRGAAAAPGSQPRSAKPQKKPGGVQRNRGGPAECRLKNTPVTQAATAKKPTSKKGSKRAPPGPKLSKSRKGSGKPPAAAPSAATPCKDEAGTETSGDRTAASKESDSIPETDGVPPEKGSPLREDGGDVISKPLAKTQRSKGQMSMQQKDVKTEESEKEEGENDIKQEEAPEVVMRGETQVEVETETPKKRGRQKDDKAARPPKRRKKPPVQYVRCEMEGCGTVLAHPRYLQHHIKYQHLLKKKYVCDYPSCGRLFRLQKQLFRHAKHHTDQRDYICEYCARAFKSSHNLAVHRMIHTGEKPIQCEICGFTCRQKASLNWHMKKHDAEASYQFSCSICNKKFEKKDSVVAHKAKSHPEVLIAEAMAANGGSVISTSVTETIAETAVETQESVPVLTPPPAAAPSEPQEEAAAAGALTPLQQVVLAPPPQPSPPQGQFLQLPSHHVVQVQQQAPAFLQLSAAAPPNPGTQLIQLAAGPPIPATYPQGTLFTLTSVAALAPQQSVQWERTGAEEKDCEMPGEGELWDRVVVGAEEQAVGDMMWEGNGERRREDEGIAW